MAKSFLIMREDEILGILERAGAATGGKRASSQKMTAALFLDKFHNQQEKR